MGWSNIGLKGTLGAGCLAALGIWADWLDAPRDAFLTGYLPLFALTFAPFMILLFIRRGEVPDRVARMAHRVAAAWYAALVAATLALIADQGFKPELLFLTAFMALGLWPCVEALRGRV